MLLPGRVTPHTLRRTSAMLALTAGRDVRWVMALALGSTWTRRNWAQDWAVANGRRASDDPWEGNDERSFPCKPQIRPRQDSNLRPAA